MKPGQQRIAIAEACGWTTPTRLPTFPDIDQWMNHNGYPDYLNDLNAMHEAEKTLETGLRGRYLLNLERTTNNAEQKAWPEVTATAAQRAEAFLKTLNLWTDTEP